MKSLTMPPADLEQRAIAAYLGMAIGDALGATVEFMTPREIQYQYKVHDTIRGGGWLKLRAGEVTDDTTMALALGRSILASGGVDARAVAQAFDRWMRSKPVDIGNTVRRGILHFRTTGEPLVPPNDHDGGNGACMRVLPVALALYHTGEETRRAAALVQARVTHHHPLSDAGTACIAEMVVGLLHGRSRNELLHGAVASLVEQHPKFRFRPRRRENPSGYIVDTLQAVFQGFFDSDSFEDCLIETVNRGGDADTTGAIAGMVAGACYGPEAIPRRWLNALSGAVRESCEAQALDLVRMG